MLTLAFYPVDSWFFRESRPMDSLGGTSLGNQFPPTPATLMGALRTRLGELLGIDWNNVTGTPLPSWWGDADQWGELTLRGPWLSLDGEVYLPAPASLLRTKAQDGYVRLLPGTPVHSDLGQVRLPTLPAGTLPGVKPLDGYWLPQSALTRFLGEQALADKTPVYQASDLFSDEYRLGIALDHTRRSVLDGQLYQTRHLRPRRELAVMVTLEGLPPEQEAALKQSLVAQPLLRLGGEGRMAQVKIATAPAAVAASGSIPKAAKLMAVALGNIPLAADAWPLPGFRPQTLTNGRQVWCGELGGYPLTLCCMANGKMLRQGGWDLQRHRPRPVQSLLPAGSVFFFDEAPLGKDVSLALHLSGQRIPFALGWWRDPSTSSKD